jgi:hypothetical protein
MTTIQNILPGSPRDQGRIGPTDEDDEFDPFDFSNDPVVEGATPPSRKPVPVNPTNHRPVTVKRLQAHKPLPRTPTPPSNAPFDGRWKLEFNRYELRLESGFSQSLDWSLDAKHRYFFAKKTFTGIMKSYRSHTSTLESWDPLALAY